MDDFSSLKAVFTQWASELPARTRQALADRPAKARAGERHGSWFVSVTWTAEEILRSAEVALTNPGPSSDINARSVVMSGIAGATSQDRFVVEAFANSTRAISRLDTDELEELLLLAIARAENYAEASLSQHYLTGVNPGNSQLPTP